jgi:hypothetical protein
VFLVMFDNAKERLIQLSSADDFNIETVANLVSPQMLPNFAYEKYTNKDYMLFQKQSTDNRNPKSHKRNRVKDWVKEANKKK